MLRRMVRQIVPANGAYGWWNWTVQSVLPLQTSSSARSTTPPAQVRAQS
jgi:hypothetical protein